MERVWWAAGWMKNAMQGLFNYIWWRNPDRNDGSSDEIYNGTHLVVAGKAENLSNHWKKNAVILKKKKEELQNKARENGNSEEADKYEKELCETLTVYTSVNPLIKIYTLK